MGAPDFRKNVRIPARRSICGGVPPGRRCNCACRPCSRPFHRSRVPGLPQLICTFPSLKNRALRHYVPTLACGRCGTENPLSRQNRAIRVGHLAHLQTTTVDPSTSRSPDRQMRPVGHANRRSAQDDRMTDRGSSCQDIGVLRLRRCKRRTASAQDDSEGGPRSPVSWTRSHRVPMQKERSSD